MEPTEAAEESRAAGGSKKGRGTKANRGGGCTGSENARRRKEARMASNSELGGQEAGLPRFSEEAFDRLLSRYSRRLERCVTAELARNRGLKRMEVLGTAMSSGELYNVRMPNVSKVGDCCVWRALRGAKVPKFAGTNREFSVPLSLE